MAISIIIPTKNEELNITKLLDLLLLYFPQDTEIIISDAGSSDGTIEIIESYKDSRIKIINGGLPSVGRNKGADVANSKYLLFIDADMIPTKELVDRTLELVKESKYKLLGCRLNTKSSFKSKILYKLCNYSIFLSTFDKPFVVGGYFCIESNLLHRLGGFDETVLHCEDYCLSSQVDVKDFYYMKEYVFTGDRRIEKMGFFGMLFYFAKNTIYRNQKKYFKNDVGYWK